MNRFVVAEPLWCTGCNTCLAACSDVHKTQGLQQHPRPAPRRRQSLPCRVITVRKPLPAGLPGQCHLSEG